MLEKMEVTILAEFGLDNAGSPESNWEKARPMMIDN
jgi:hypothetical protein